MSIFINNWKVYKNEECDICVSAWIPETEHKKFQLNNDLKKMATGNHSVGRGTSSRQITHYEYFFKPTKVNRMKSSDPMWRFDVKYLTIGMSFGARVQNNNYEVQTLEQIEEILGC